MNRRSGIPISRLVPVFAILLVSVPRIALAGSSTAERPKIGLVLSGGGARGLAHIGALKVIEELRIPVDYIAGTSMGSIVGGLYASGLSPEEIEREILGIDWDDLFNDRMKRTERTFRRKEDDGAEFFNFELGVKGLKPVMASGLVAGQKLALAFDVDEIYTTDRQDFDDLKIPFRAVATDLNEGRMVVLGKGSLVHAVRASMSIPGIFAPVHFQGRYLVDGGLVRNLPCDVAKEMGADIIIAVDVGSMVEQKGAGPIQSLAEVSRQSFNIMLRETSRSVIGMADVYIPLGLEGISASDFRKADMIMAEGEETARAFIEELSEYTVDEAEYADFIKRHRHGPALPVSVAGIRLNNLSRVKDSEIERRITVSPGDTLDRQRLREDFLRLYELGIFESVDHRLIERDEGTDLLIEVREKFYSPNILSVGVDYIDDLDGKSDFAVLARYSRLEINRFGGELRADLRLGLSRGFRAEYYQPVEPTRTLFLAPSAEAVTSTRNIYTGDHKIAEYQTRYIGIGIDAGFQLGKFIELRAGFRHRRINTSVDVGDVDLPEQWKTRNEMTASVASDFLDDPDFPTSGGAMAMTFQASTLRYGGEEKFQKLEVHGAHFLTLWDMTLFGTLAGGTDFGDELPFDEKFTFGGAHSFSGLKEGQRTGGAFGVARGGFYFPFWKGPVLVGPHFYLGSWIEAGNVYDSWTEVDRGRIEYSGAIFVGVKSILGPVMMGYGLTSDGFDSAFLTAGRQFGSF